MNAVRVTILVEQGYVPTELALVQDVLRIATRLSSDVSFVQNVCTTHHEEFVEGLGGSLVRASPFQTGSIARLDHLVVLGGAGVRAAFNRLKTRLSWVERMGVSVTLLSDAAAEWKHLHPETEQLTTHWEIQQLDRDAGGTTAVSLPLFSQNARITTSGGMTATADLVLMQIIAPRSLHLAQSVAQVLLMGDIRDGTSRQPRSENDVMTLRHFKLRPVIAAMESSIESPLSMSELAVIGGVSIRQLERKMKTAFGQTPAAFYRSLRLRRARALVEQTTLSISEISVACGFPSMSNFAKKYAQEFRISPSKQRAQLSAVSRPLCLPSIKQGLRNASLPLSQSAPSSLIYATGADEALVQGARG